VKTCVAVIGAGFMGRTHAASYGKGGLDSEVAYVVDSDAKRAAELAASLGPRARGLTDIGPALADPEVNAVDICLPTPFHRELCVRAFASGKNVLCEKPIAPSLEDADAMQMAAKASGKIFMVAHVMRFWPEYVEAVRILREGGIGSLKRVSCERLSTPPAWSAGSWLLDLKQSGGTVRDLAIHDFDFLNQLAGMPTEARAIGDLMDFAASFRFAGDVVGTVWASYSMPRGFPFRMSFILVGESGSIEFDGSGGSLRVVREGKVEEVAVKGSRTFRQNESGEGLDGYFYEIAHFVDCVGSGRQPEQGKPEDARNALAIALDLETRLI
jgi:predicted dehydrogenase